MLTIAIVLPMQVVVVAAVEVVLDLVVAVAVVDQHPPLVQVQLPNKRTI
jgi:hypothetical protein